MLHRFAFDICIRFIAFVALCLILFNFFWWSDYWLYDIITLWKVLETGDDLGEVTETVDYYVQGATIAAGNLFGRYAAL